MKTTPRLAVPLITPENRKQFFWPAAFFMYFAYTLTGGHRIFAPWHPPVTVIDDWIPFLPWTVWIYLSHIALLFTGWWYVVKGEGCTRVFWMLVLGSVLSTVFFLFFPTELPRRTLDMIDTGPVTGAVWAFLLSADHPTNCFPSMHIAEATLSAIGLMRASDAWRIAAPAWAFFVSLTTMTTEQHLFVDVCGGLAFAGICFFLVERFVVVEHMPPGEAEAA